jgi:hypothetical protein
MKRIFLSLLFLYAFRCESQEWHLNTEPVYFFLKAPNIALDYNINSSLALGFQYAALDWAQNGSNLSGLQLFYSRTSQISSSSEVLKLYLGFLSRRTTLLGIEAKDNSLPVVEVLYGYRWVVDKKLTIAVLAGTFFTTKHIYPSVSIPIGYFF